MSHSIEDGPFLWESNQSSIDSASRSAWSPSGCLAKLQYTEE
jgi:hypothetical protein